MSARIVTLKVAPQELLAIVTPETLKKEEMPAKEDVKRSRDTSTTNPAPENARSTTSYQLGVKKQPSRAKRTVKQDAPAEVRADSPPGVMQGLQIIDSGDHPQNSNHSEVAGLVPTGGPVTPGPYQQVIVLVVYFGSFISLKSRKSEVAMVVDAFRSYNYSVVRYELPPQWPTPDFVTRLQTLKKHVSDQSLLIVYYAGHGGLWSGNSNCLFFGIENDSDNDKTLWWRDLYPQLLSFPCDVLTCIDCCHAGATALTQAHIDAVKTLYSVDGTYSKEVIASSGFESLTWSGQTFSFPFNLALMLARHKATPSFDTATLVNELSFKLRRHYEKPNSSPDVPRSVESRPVKRKRNEDGPKPCPANPMYIPLVRARRPPIALTPLLQPSPRTRALNVAEAFCLQLHKFIQVMLSWEALEIENAYEDIKEALTAKWIADLNTSAQRRRACTIPDSRSGS